MDYFNVIEAITVNTRASDKQALNMRELTNDIHRIVALVLAST